MIYEYFLFYFFNVGRRKYNLFIAINTLIGDY